MAERLFTIPITCYFDRRAHEVTDENIVAGHRPGWLWRILHLSRRHLTHR